MEQTNQFKQVLIDQYSNNPFITSLLSHLMQSVDRRDASDKDDPAMPSLEDMEAMLSDKALYSDNLLTFSALCQRLQSQIDPSYNPGNNVAHLLYGRHTLPGLAGKLQGVMFNGNQVCLEVSPFAHLCEQRLIDLILAFMGYSAHSGAWALPTVGGSEANMLSLTLARERYFNSLAGLSVSEQGLLPAMLSLPVGVSPVILLPESAHYCWEKSARVLGLGAASMVSVPVDKRHRLDVAALTRLLKRHGRGVMAVISVLGSTEFGAVDPIDDIHQALIEHGEAHNYQPWHHVDAALGGPAIRLDKYRRYGDIVRQADSLTIDPHKLLFTPYNCGTLIVREPELLSVNNVAAPYIEHYNVAGIDRTSPGRYRLAGSMDTSGILAAYYTLATLPFSMLDSMVESCLEQAAYFSRLLLQSGADGMVLVNPEPDLNIVGVYWSCSKDHRAFHVDVVNGLKQVDCAMQISTTTLTVIQGQSPILIHRFCFMSPDLDRATIALMAKTYLRVVSAVKTNEAA